MRRVPESNYPVRDLFGKGKHGFGPGDKTNGTVATIPGAPFMNAVQEEISNAIEGFGVTLDADNNAQLLDVLLNRVGARLDSIASLRDFTGGGAVKIVQVAGYYADTPGIGGGFFVSLGNDSSSADNGGTVIVSSDGVRWLRVGDVNPECFGARGDGVTDDTAAFESLESAFKHRRVEMMGKIFKTTRNFTGNHYVDGIITTGRNQDYANGKLDAAQTLLCNGAGSLLTMVRTVADQRTGRAARSIIQGAAQDPQTGEFWTLQPYSDVSDGAGGTVEASVLVRYPAAFGGSAEIQQAQMSDASADIGHQSIGISYQDGLRYFWATGGTIKKDKRQLYVVRFQISSAGVIEGLAYFTMFTDGLHNGDGNNCVAVSPDGQFLVSTCKYSSSNMWIARVWRIRDLVAGGDNTDNWLYEIPLRAQGSLPVQDIALDGDYIYVLYGGSASVANVYSVFTLGGVHVMDYTDESTGKDLMAKQVAQGYSEYYEPEAFAVCNIGGQLVLTQWISMSKKNDHHTLAVYAMRPLLPNYQARPTTYGGDAAVVPKEFVVRVGSDGVGVPSFSAGFDTNAYSRVYNGGDYLGITTVNNTSNRRYSVITQSVKDSKGGNITFYSLKDTGGATENLGVLRLAGAVSESYLDIGQLAVYPSHTEVASLGMANKLWAQIYAKSGAINTSDEREKQDVDVIPDAVIEAWRDVGFCQYRWRAAVAEKADGARYHTGLIAQRIRDVFDSHGLDAQHYGLLCYDQWPATSAADAVLDDDGNIIEPAAEAREAGERWGIRADECLFMEAESNRRRFAELSARIEALEAAK